MCIVYCLTNLKTNMRYVGWTNKTLEQRWKGHVSTALIRKRKFLLSKAIRQYGPGDDVWHRDVLIETYTPEDAKMHEIAFIKAFNTCAASGGIGYNMTLGGDGGTLSGKSNPFYGRHHTTASIQKMRNTLGERLSGENNPQWGKRGELSPCWKRKHTSEELTRISNANKGKKRTDEQRARMRESNAKNREKRSLAQRLRRERERCERESLS